MLLAIPRLMVISQKFPRMFRVRRRPRDRIELMIPHDTARGTRLHHPPHQIHRCQLLRTPVNQVTHENDRSVRMTPGPAVIAISKVRE